jgi:glycosyltransferase involved in cell wall biosynthesis
VRIVIVSERLVGRDDEGIKNLARHLLRVLSKGHEVLALSKLPWPGRDDVRGVRMNSYFLNRRLLRELRGFRPDRALYIPWTSGTPRTLLRARVLRIAARCPVALLLAQPYEMGRSMSLIARWLLPDLVLAMSDSVIAQYRDWGARAEFIAAGVDLARFDLPTRERRAAVREKLGVSADDRLVLHVGHLNRGRLDSSEMTRLARQPSQRVLVIGSPDTPQDPSLIQELTNAGCIVRGEFEPRIEDYYGAADAYLFPTSEERRSIGVPLSVLEALACGVPVVARPFASLPRLFESTAYVTFAISSAEIEEALAMLPRSPDRAARSLVARLDWSDIGTRLTELLSDRAGPS